MKKIILLLFIFTAGCFSKEAKFESCVAKVEQARCFENDAYKKIRTACCERAGINTENCEDEKLKNLVANKCNR
ncbi:hypothetical protein K2X05_12965 [bacterium]|nr:hypothetical protein [bacterium]